MIQVYKIMNGIDNLDRRDFFEKAAVNTTMRAECSGLRVTDGVNATQTSIRVASPPFTRGTVLPA